MSDSKLTAEQRESFRKWMDEKTPLIGKCGLCSVRSWQLLDQFLEVRPFTGGGLVIGGGVYPHVAIMCTNCGNTHFINAIISGLIAERDDAASLGESDE